jgi:hypothetical protein
MKGLRWNATDIDWQLGDGSEVAGSAEALVLVASGRPVALNELSGDGVATISTRLSSA